MSDATNSRGAAPGDEPAPANDGPSGEEAGVDTLFESTYRELRHLARARLRGGGRDVLLDTTALVHDSYEKMARSGDVRFPDRARFFVYASKVMRSIIADAARQRMADRRGGDMNQVPFTARLAGGSLTGEEEVLQVHDALDRLAKVDERMAKVVEMRYFGGLTELEIAEALGVTDRTVRRDWEQARLFLAEALRG